MSRKAPTGKNSSMPVSRKQLILKGTLQGIGFRPTVYRLATTHGLLGWVINTTEAVRIEIEGTDTECDRFISELPAAIPPPGQIETFEVREISPIGGSGFSIQASLSTKREITPIPPDVATCDDCVAELFDPDNRRYLYPFITCTLCGPRFSVVRSFPYDRERTSMADFVMCEECRSEYENPNDRRFHSQTNSCPKCGPRLSLLGGHSIKIAGDPILESIRLLKAGRIVAIKGIGGFHLAVDALNEMAVQRLRDLKSRSEKPFAVMAAGVQEALKYCSMDSHELQALTSVAAPIVLLGTQGEKAPSGIAPLVGTLGMMLPYAPVHHLLFKHPDFEGTDSLSLLVMTSGNKSEEPIAAGNEEALERLDSIADAFLIHDREIVLRTDDSIVRVMNGCPSVFRRSRGYVPMSFPLDDMKGVDTERIIDYGAPGSPETESFKEPTVLGVGADMKNAPAILEGKHLTPGPHVGDLESPEAQDYFVRSVETLTDYLEATPSIIAYDPHPAYFSSNLAIQNEKYLAPVFHHHAHAVSLLFEHGLRGPVLSVVFDGTGYGEDGTIWGGEFLLADRHSFQRLARLSRFPLIGAESAIKEPLRIAAAILAISNAGVIPESVMGIFSDVARKTVLWLEALKSGINCPLTSSAGRLFDAAAVVAGFRRAVTFEGQAAMWLESIVDESENESYEINFRETSVLECDVGSLLRAMADDATRGTTANKLAARFHNSMANLVVNTVQRISGRCSSNMVGLTGGCFQNKRLTELTSVALQEAGFQVLCHSRIPVNDGGIAIGQAVAGREMWSRRDHFQNTML
jgi:hydrogenase maturation protein HypF